MLIGFILIFLISLILKFQVFISYLFIFTFFYDISSIKKRASLQWQLQTNSLSLLGNVSYLWKYFDFTLCLPTHVCMENRVNCLSFTFTLMLMDKSVKAYIPVPLPSLEMCWNLCTFICPADLFFEIFIFALTCWIY